MVYHLYEIFDRMVWLLILWIINRINLNKIKFAFHKNSTFIENFISIHYDWKMNFRVNQTSPQILLSVIIVWYETVHIYIYIYGWAMVLKEGGNFSFSQNRRKSTPLTLLYFSYQSIDILSKLNWILKSTNIISTDSV